jgi:hypothetical protein
MIAALRFLHIAKTAGTTFRAVLENAYRGRAVFAFTGDSSIDLPACRAFLGDHDGEEMLFLGHAPVRTGISEVDAVPTITILRDPIDRVCSFCRHVAEGKSPHLAERFPAGCFDLDEFLASGDPELSNLQTKMLLNTVHCADDTVLCGVSGEAAVGEAVDVLARRLICFGVQDFFDESLILFSTRLSWGLPLYKPQNRPRTGGGLCFGDHHLRRIAEMNPLDILVYARARAMFLDRFAGLPFGPARCAMFRYLNNKVKRHWDYLAWRFGL